MADMVNVQDHRDVKEESIEGAICKICYLGNEDENSLLSPCLCKGSMEFVHEQCLEKWIQMSGSQGCGACKYPYQMNSYLLPFKTWKFIELVHFDCWKILYIINILLPGINIYFVTIQKVYPGAIEWWKWFIFIVSTIEFAKSFAKFAKGIYDFGKKVIDKNTRWHIRNVIKDENHSRQ